MVNVNLTKQDLNIISDGILHLIADVNTAYKLVSADDASRNAIEAYRERIVKLHSNLCALYPDDED